LVAHPPEIAAYVCVITWRELTGLFYAAGVVKRLARGCPHLR